MLLICNRAAEMLLAPEFSSQKPKKKKKNQSSYPEATLNQAQSRRYQSYSRILLAVRRLTADQ